MSAGWVAAQVRGRGLVRRRVGREAARRLATSPSLEAAVADLARTPYGHDVRSGMTLPAAQHAVSAALLWHLRVLAGWGPPLGAGRMRLLAAGFEIANISGYLEGLRGRPAPEPYRLGAMAGAWPAIRRARTPAEVRRALAASAWGDPGTDDPAGMRLALYLAWARRVVDGVPEAAGWAASSAVLDLARAVASGALPAPATPAARDARRILGARWQGARTVGDLAREVPRSTAWVLDGAAGAEGGGGEQLWRCEARWWGRVEADGFALAVRPRAEPGAVVGVVGLLAADAWRVRAALEIAARGGGRLVEVLDVVA